MNCIIVEDEPLAREGIEAFCAQTPGLVLQGSFNNATAALAFLEEHPVDLVLLDIHMPGMTGLELARVVTGQTLIIFTTAYSDYAVDSYELDALDYLVKPIPLERFQRAIAKATTYHQLLGPTEPATAIESITEDFIFVKADRKYFKIMLDEILYIEGLKDYVVMHLEGDRRIITAMNIKTIYQQLPPARFARTSKSHIVQVKRIDTFDNNTVTIGTAIVPIGSIFREQFLNQYIRNKIVRR